MNTTSFYSHVPWNYKEFDYDVKTLHVVLVVRVYLLMDKVQSMAGRLVLGME